MRFLCFGELNKRRTDDVFASRMICVTNNNK